MDLKRLKVLRIKKKVSIGELSRRTGINGDRISLIERGRVNPSFGSVVAIAQALDMEVGLFEVKVTTHAIYLG